MPELPDVEVYVEALRDRVLGQPLERVRLGNPFLLRTVDPPLPAFAGRRVASVSRLGKRVVLEFDGDLFLSVHLMIAGRLHWKPAGAKLPGKVGLAALDFPDGTLTLTEAGTKRRAALHAFAGRAGLSEWTERLRRQAGGGFPEGVTAFREGMAVHGRHRQPCPVCATPVQRIVHAENETDYCPRCQTGGRILSDRSLARLLRDDWPRTVEEMEALDGRRRQGTEGSDTRKGTP